MDELSASEEYTDECLNSCSFFDRANLGRGRSLTVKKRHRIIVKNSGSQMALITLISHNTLQDVEWVGFPISSIQAING